MSTLSEAADRLPDAFEKQQTKLFIETLALASHTWADSIFPNRTLGGMAIKLYEEIGEWLRDPSNESEFADVLIMVLDAALKAGITDMTGAILRKLAVNQKRNWKIDQQMGTLHHDDRNDATKD